MYKLILKKYIFNEVIALFVSETQIYFRKIPIKLEIIYFFKICLNIHENSILGSSVPNFKEKEKN